MKRLMECSEQKKKAVLVRIKEAICVTRSSEVLRANVYGECTNGNMYESGVLQRPRKDILELKHGKIGVLE